MVTDLLERKLVMGDRKDWGPGGPRWASQWMMLGQLRWMVP